MRLHRLEVQAFGSFPGREVIDFDELSEAGLFLVHGDTGAGKTTILDAVSFALYGEVPGVRGKDELRSHHSPADLPTEVHLEATLGGRRVRIHRTPRQERPKKRGTGTITDQPTVLFSEQLEEGWGNDLTRLDEVGMRVTQLIGMGASQFRQVAMLPQGGFAEFLRSDAKKRSELLEKLFDTGRFDQVTAWLGDRARDLAVQVEGATATIRAEERSVERILSVEPAPGTGTADGAEDRAADGSQGGVGDGGSAADEPIERDLATLPNWVEDHAATASAHADRCARDLAQAKRTRDDAVASEGEATELARRQRCHREATEQLAALAELAEEHLSRTRRLADADRAAPLRANLVDLEVRRSAADAATVGLAAAWSDLRAMFEEAAAAAEAPPALAELLAAGPPDGLALAESGACAPTTDELVAGLEASITEADQAMSQGDALQALTRQMAERGTALERAERDVVRLQKAIAQLESRAEALPERVDGARSALDEAKAAAASMPGREAARDQAAKVLAAATDRDRLSLEVEAAAEVLHERREAWHQARQTTNDLRERRLDQIAAELAQRLAPGDPCQVCGSVEHPAPASPGAEGLVTPEAIEDAEQHATAAESLCSEADSDLARLHSELAASARAAGDVTLAEAEVQHARAAAEVTDAAASAIREGSCRAELEELEGEKSLIAEEASTLGTDLATARERVVQLTEQSTADRTRLTGGLAGHVDVDSFRSAAVRRRGVLDNCRQALATALDAQRELRRAEESVERAVTEAHFVDLDQATGALLPADELRALRMEVRRHDEAVAVVQQQVDDPDLKAAAYLPEPDLAGCRAAREQAEGTVDAAVERSTRAGDAAASLAAAAQRITDGLEELGPVHQRYTTVKHLAELTAGGGGNELRMKLGTFVLAAKLEEVTEAANVHLARMSSDRYAFVYSDAVEDGRKQAGLGLRVHDAWNETERDASTLSGGETFFASLALALGLAEVVTNASGGTRIDTLFIDEGFGSLDERTLGEVMETLDGLRDGGRTIGVVSHVGAMRDRIQAHVHVQKGTSGSTVTTRTGQPV